MNKPIIAAKQFYGILCLAIMLLPALPAICQTTINRDKRISDATGIVSSSSLKRTVEELVSFHTRHNMSTQSKEDSGIGAAAAYLEKRLSAFSLGNEAHFSVQRTQYKAGGQGSRIPRVITLPNIVATIKGSLNPEAIIVLLAHFDSRTQDNSDSTAFAPGANDNGSGVAALIEIASILSSHPLPVTVKLMFLSGEEHGLLGATHMASVAKEENWNILAVLNNDMVSNSHSSDTDNRNNNILRVFSETIPSIEDESMARERSFNSSENDSQSRQLARYIKEVGERYTDNMEIKLIYRNDRFGRGGDHTPFSRNGFNAVRICEYYENYDRTHKVTETIDGKEYGDVLEGVDPEYLRKNTIVNLSVVMNIAYAPAPPAEVYTDVSGLSNLTRIYWKNAAGCTEPYGYYLLVRETDSPVWQKKIFVKGNEIEVPYSKDNYFFAVQSVNETGNESLYVFSKGKR